jgi:hypothetical protein
MLLTHQISWIHFVGTEMFQVYDQAERHDEANSLILQFVKVLNKVVFIHMILPVLCMK